MLRRANPRPVEAAACHAIASRRRVPAATLEPSQTTRLPAVATALWVVHPRRKLYQNGSQSRGHNALNTRTPNNGFTLVELLVTIVVLALLVFFVTSLVNSAATITTLGNKRMDADSQARQLLDRMAIDFAQMMKRNDVDFFAKGTTAPNSVGGAMTGNDQIAFFTQLPGYYPTSSTMTSRSPVSLIAYRVNSDSTNASLYNKFERMDKGLVWNGATTADIPVVFMPLTIGISTASPLGTWPAATSSTASDTAYDVVGSQVFRFEYCYLLKNGTLVITPPLDTTPLDTNGRADLSQISALVVDIAVIDPKSKVLLTNAQLATLTTPGASNFLSEYAAGMTPGQLRAQWQNKLDGITSLPRPAISGIRLYERYFYLSPPTQGTL
jgi:prepilin-type N-terminal cleavage/methylation domain-containing protein